MYVYDKDRGLRTHMSAEEVRGLEVQYFCIKRNRTPIKHSNLNFQADLIWPGGIFKNPV
jgi:hypothetical protein